MNTIIKALETIGQNISINQFKSTEEMMKSQNFTKDILSKMEKAEVDYVCYQEPGDDEEK